jgi:hypothetical protein
MAMTLRMAAFAAIAGLLPPIYVQASDVFSVPSSMGAVVRTNMKEGVPQPDYVLIQDVHGHGEAQVHIAELLRLLREHWGIKEAFIEGAFSKVEKHDLPAAYMDAQSRALLTKQGELSGPELAFLETTDVFDLIGVDDPGLYRQALQIYQQLRMDHAALMQEEQPASTLERALLNLEMTPAQYDLWQTQASATSSSQRLTDAIRVAESFYAVTDQRSRVFLAKAAAAPVQGPRVLVTGGYHMQKMCALLEQEGKSFIVVRPTLTRGGFAHVYAAHLEQSARLLQTPTLIVSAAR